MASPGSSGEDGSSLGDQSGEDDPETCDAKEVASGLTEDDLTLNFGPSEPVHSWKKLSSCEEFVGYRRSKHTIVAWNEKVYIFGGDNGRRMLNDFLVSHIRDSSWARVIYTGRCEAS